MRVFLSWSGEYTRCIAEVFYEWLPLVIQSVEPFISSGEIKAGDRWQSRINDALENIDFGIIFVTPENKDKPWIMFETGALSKNLGTSKIIPVLCNAQEIDFTGNPLLQFQYVRLEQEGVLQILHGICHNLSDEDITLSEHQISEIFAVFWPKLKTKLETVPAPKLKNKNKADNDDRLSRIEEALSGMISNIKQIQYKQDVMNSVGNNLPQVSPGLRHFINPKPTILAGGQSIDNEGDD